MVVPLERLINMNTQKFKDINSFNLNVRNTQFVQKIAVRRVDYHFFSLLKIYVHVVVRRPIQELSNIYVHLAGLTFINKFWKRCVIESGTIWKLGYGFLFAFHSNYGRIFNHFGDTKRQAVAWPWNLLLGSIKVTENGAVRQTIYDFLLVCHCNYSSVLYRLRVI